MLLTNTCQEEETKFSEGGYMLKGTDRCCKAYLEPVYESWAINRTVYSIVAAPGF